MSQKFRKEQDALGEQLIPKEAFYGIHSLRGERNFIKSGEKIHPVLIKTMLQVKLAAAKTNMQIGELDKEKGEWICRAIDDLLELTEQAIQGQSEEIFSLVIVDPYQGGAGTSFNMNINEIIANKALELAGKNPGDYRSIHPMDDVNKSQSTNDVFPSAVKVASIYLLRELSEAFAEIQGELQEKEKEFGNILKPGRTQMQDAVPISLGQEFGAWAQAMARDRWRLYKVEERLRFVNLGGTAIGTGVAADKKYILHVVNTLREITGLGIAKGEDLIDQTQNLDVYVEVHGLLKAGAASLIKIAQDLRFLGSGPHAGIGEIILPPMQAGSSIMPGKINPVIPEHVIQVCQMIFAHDGVISQLVSMGHLELNPFLPLISHLFLKSFSFLKNIIYIFIDKCINNIKANQDVCQKYVLESNSAITFIISKFGYDRTAEFVKKAEIEGLPVIKYLIQHQLISPEEVDKGISSQLGSKL